MDLLSLTKSDEIDGQELRDPSCRAGWRWIVDGRQSVRAQRSRCLRKGRVIFNNGFSSVDATVRNLSDAGARLEGENFSIAPDEFDLLIFDTSGKFEKRHARKAWNKARFMGVKFIADDRHSKALATA